MGNEGNQTVTAAQVESAILCLREIDTGNVECVKTSDPIGYLTSRIMESDSSFESLTEDDPEHILYKAPKPTPTFNDAVTSTSTTPPEPPSQPDKPDKGKLASTFTEARENTIHEGRAYSVPDNFDPVLRAITKGDQISYELMVKVLGSESNFDNDAVSHSGAFSAGQFVTSTFHQRAWENRNLLSAEHRTIVEANLEEYDRAKENEAALAKAENRDPRYVPPDPKWRIKEGGSAEAIKNLSKNEYVVSVLAREQIREGLIDGEERFRNLVEKRLNWLKNPKNPEHLPENDPRIQRLQEHLDRPMTFTDAKTFYVMGAKGGAQLLLAYADTETQDHRARDYTTQTVVENNKPLFEHPDGRNRSVPEYMDYMHERVGNKPLPDDLTRPEHLPEYAMNYDVATKVGP